VTAKKSKKSGEEGKDKFKKAYGIHMAPPEHTFYIHQ
jgi:hypothetical protein